MTEEKYKGLWPDLALLFLLGLFLIGLNYYWLSLDPQFPEWDHTKHLDQSIDFFRLFFQQLNPVSVLGPLDENPPLLFFITSLFYLVSGFSRGAAYFSVMIYVWPLLFGLYMAGRTTGSRLTAWIFALVALSSPIAVDYSHKYYEDYPTAAFIALGIWSLLWAGDFSDRKKSIWCGVILGLGALVKFIHPMVMFLPVIWTAWIVYDPIRREAKKRGKPLSSFPGFTNLILAMGIAAVIAVPWYLLKFGTYTKMWAFMTYPRPETYKPLYQMLFAYIRDFNNIFFMACPLLIIGTILLLVFRGKAKAGVLALIAFVSGLVLISLSRVPPTARYLVDLMPPVVILSFYWVGLVKKRWQILIFPLVLLLSAWQLTGWIILKNRGFPPDVKTMIRTVSMPGSGLSSKYFLITGGILKKISGDLSHRNNRPVSIFISNHSEIQAMDLQCLRHQGIEEGLFGLNEMIIYYENKGDPEKDLRKSDYMVLSAGDDEKEVNKIIEDLQSPGECKFIPLAPPWKIDWEFKIPKSVNLYRVEHLRESK
ncbi:MAG: glycosyltransferase family 39 protein [Chloroflexi bacterium]|nr:glycosyltransferase family 39 protein [Chloroflexota bacterium]